MDLLDETRTLVHTGKLLRQPDGNLEWNGWSELFVLLFDNYSELNSRVASKIPLTPTLSGDDEDEGERWCDEVPR